MSWWAQKIAETLKLNDNNDEEEHQQQNDDEEKEDDNNYNNNKRPQNPKMGVKEDLNELTETLTRQFRTFSSFLAPPPPSADVAPSSDVAGIRTELAEIGGKLRIGIFKLSDNIYKTDFSKIASGLVSSRGEEGGDVAAVGVTEEVAEFVRGVVTRPETWNDFPVDEDWDDVEFDMSDAQQEHALAVERLAPRLAALRIELCPGYMSENCFWMIYFALLHPYLNEHDAEILSTPEGPIDEWSLVVLLYEIITIHQKAAMEDLKRVQIVKTRAMMTQETQNRSMTKSEHLSVPPNSQSTSLDLEAVPTEPRSPPFNNKPATDKHPILSSEVPIIDKSVIEERPKNQPKKENKYSGSSSKVDENYEDEADDWLKEESSDTCGAGKSTVHIENDEDVSFSDLEEDDGDASTSYKKVAYGSDSSTRESRDWVQLGRSSTDSTKDINTVGSENVSDHNSETKESSDWLDLEEIDVE